ncbi:helix-turn-helix domain-containing protein [Streptomyces sp. NPDC096319]|uniref:helix-turn-helix domain-containing protein n=1 Tax=Streptomyces sp. NPDC096319 TaxID=3366084 RepID=UPI0038140652
MTEVARTQGSSAAVERGEVPEAAALGNVLKGLFTRLGISQNQYAYRVHLDKSAVSRYLSGRRVAPQDFIDRLVREVEEHAGAPLRLEAKDSLRGQRLEALRVCSPDEFRLESLRDELARSRRDTERAHRTIEALHALLDKKEAEARDVTDELTRLRLDWGAERAALARAREELLREVERLGEDLTDAEHLRAEAERHGEELRETVLRLEEELSRHGSGDVPLEAFKDRLREMWEEEMLPEASRELTEAAWSRSLEDVVHLTHWLGEEAESFLRDVARLRPLEDVLALAPLMVPLDTARLRGSWTLAVAGRITPGNASAVLQAMGDETVETVMAEAVRRTRSNRDAVALVTAALPDLESLAVLPDLALALSTKSPGDPYGLRTSVELVAARRADLAAELLSNGMKWRPWGGLVLCMENLDDADVDVVFDLAASWREGTALTEFAVHLAHASTNALCHRFLTVLEGKGRLRLLDLGAHTYLLQAVTRWRASRGQ